MDVQIIMISVFMASVGGFVQYEYLLLLENTTPWPVLGILYRILWTGGLKSFFELGRRPLHSLKVTDLLSIALMKRSSLHIIKSASKIIQVRRDIAHNPKHYLSNTPGGVQASASQPPDPHCKASSIFIPQVGCCVSLYPLGVAEHNISLPNPC